MPLPELDLARTIPNRARHGRRRRSPTKPQNRSPPPATSKTLVLGEVKLLRRGEEMTGKVLKSLPVDRLSEPRREEASSRNRLAESGRVVGPAGKQVARPNRAHAESTRVEVRIQKAVAGLNASPAEWAGFYAGGAFVTSPPPSSLPVPGFCSNKSDSPSAINATIDLRKLLRLE